MDAQWERIKDMISHTKTGRPPKDDRMMLNAMFWLARSGASVPLRLASDRVQPILQVACRWDSLRIFQELNADANYENLCIDSTSIKAHPQSAGAKKGAVNSENNQFIGTSRGRKTTKIHAVVDALENPVHFLLTGGQVHDACAAIDLLSELEIEGSSILGDKAYGSQKIRDCITEQKTLYGKLAVSFLAFVHLASIWILLK